MTRQILQEVYKGHHTPFFYNMIYSVSWPVLSNVLRFAFIKSVFSSFQSFDIYLQCIHFLSMKRIKNVTKYNLKFACSVAGAHCPKYFPPAQQFPIPRLIALHCWNVQFPFEIIRSTSWLLPSITIHGQNGSRIMATDFQLRVKSRSITAWHGWLNS